MRRRARRGHGMPVWAALVILAALAVIAALWWLVAHLAVLAGVLVLVGGAYGAGRLHERKVPRAGGEQ